MARGVSVLVGRTLGLQLVTLGVTVILARLLTPADYGLFAIALSVQLVGQNLAELGLPAALVRLPEPPPRALQEATIGFMLTVTAAITATIFAAVYLLVPLFSEPGDLVKVVAVTLLAVPLYAVRAVPMAMMDREMNFGRVAAVETADTIGFNVFALIAATAGLGVFSLAGAVPVGAALGVVTAWAIQRSARRPRLDFARVKPLIGFGSQVGILGVLYLGRELGFVTLIAAIGGAATSGFYAMAKRLFSFPIALAAAVSRVGFPALSRATEERPAKTAEMIAQIAFVCGLPLALVAGAVQPLIVVLLGHEWLPSTDIVLFGSLSMLLSASLASPINGLRLAEGKPDFAILAVAVELALGFALVALLIGPLDETGIGIAMSAGTCAAVAILLVTTVPAVRLGALAVARAAVITFLAAAAGQLLPVSDDFVGLIVCLAAIGLTWLVLSVLFARQEIRLLAGVIRGFVPIAGRSG
ncbi:MAG TPA: oligosaccharide flippase family protein [Solirubrobacterales bacterium]